MTGFQHQRKRRTGNWNWFLADKYPNKLQLSAWKVLLFACGQPNGTPYNASSHLTHLDIMEWASSKVILVTFPCHWLHIAMPQRHLLKPGLQPSCHHWATRIYNSSLMIIIVRLSSDRWLLLGLVLSHGYVVIGLLDGTNKDGHHILPSESKDITPPQTTAMYLPITTGAHNSPRRMLSCMLLCPTGSSKISPKSKLPVRLME